MKRFAFLLAVFSVFAGCASQPPAATDTDRARTFDATPEAVFTAAKIALSDMNAEIINADLPSGFVSARIKLNSEFITGPMLGQVKIIYTNINLTLIPRGTRTEVRLRYFTAYADGTYPNEAPAKGYDDFWAKFSKEVK